MYNELFENVKGSLPVSSFLDCAYSSLDVIPFLKVMARSEETRKNTQKKRGQRRFVVLILKLLLCSCVHIFMLLYAQNFVLTSMRRHSDVMDVI